MSSSNINFHYELPLSRKLVDRFMHIRDLVMTDSDMNPDTKSELTKNIDDILACDEKYRTKLLAIKILLLGSLWNEAEEEPLDASA